MSVSDFGINVLHLCLCLEFSSESLSIVSEMKDSCTIDALPTVEITVPQSGYRKSSLPDSTQKPSRPPVPVFRKRTSAGNCLVRDSVAVVQEQSTSGGLPDVVDSTQHESKSLLSPVDTNGVDADSASQSSSSVSTYRHHSTPTPSLLPAVLATSAASIAMITIQGQSTAHGSSSSVKQRHTGTLVTSHNTAMTLVAT